MQMIPRRLLLKSDGEQNVAAFSPGLTRKMLPEHSQHLSRVIDWLHGVVCRSDLQATCCGGGQLPALPRMRLCTRVHPPTCAVCSCCIMWSLFRPKQRWYC